VNEQYDFFLGGVIQGSVVERTILPQDYREEIKRIVSAKTPNRSLYCPVSRHRTSVEYTDAQASDVFHKHLDLALTCRFLIAFLPTASMGTAIEIWECRKAGVPVLTITPMKHNWVVRLFSTKVFGDLREFEEWLSEANLQDILGGTNS
jgi:hypothetical protein